MPLFSEPPAALPAALRERLMLAVDVAKAKYNSGAPVEDRVREREVLFAAIRQGVRMGVDPEVTLKVFSAQIEASKLVQNELIRRWKGLPSFNLTPDSLKKIRPKLDALTPAILMGLKHRRYWPDSALRFDFKDPALRRAWVTATKPVLLPKLDRSRVASVGAPINLRGDRPSPRRG